MPEPDEIRAIIERHNANLCRWYAAGNVDAVVDVFAEDCWQMPPHSEPLVGRAALREFWKQAVRWADWHFTLETQDVIVSGSTAVERGKYFLRVAAKEEAPPGFRSLEDRGNYLVLWRQEAGGEWRAVWDAPVSTMPLPAL
jgi:ketosteroid isomerase-like protein